LEEHLASLEVHQVVEVEVLMGLMTRNFFFRILGLRQMLVPIFLLQLAALAEWEVHWVFWEVLLGVGVAAVLTGQKSPEPAIVPQAPGS